MVRDVNGQFVYAYANFFGMGTNMLAEIHYLRDGLALCQELGLDSVEIETDSLVSVQVLSQTFSYPWRYEYELRKCRRLLRHFDLRHVYRKQNQVADRLATSAHQTRASTIYYTLSQLPRSVLLPFKQDLFGFYYYRV